MNSCTEPEQKEILRLLGQLLKNEDFSLLNEALRIASEHGHPSADQIKHCFYSLMNRETPHTAIKLNMSLPKVPDITRGLSHYDSLFQQGGAADER